MAAKAAIEKLDQKLVATLRERDILKIKPV
jgi:hypothetical protein